MARLSDDDDLANLPGWDHRNGAIVADLRFEGFPDAVAYLVRAGFAAEAADHHPDLDLRYNRIRVALSTHSEGGVTEKDLDLARRLQELAPT